MVKDKAVHAEFVMNERTQLGPASQNSWQWGEGALEWGKEVCFYHAKYKRVAGQLLKNILKRIRQDVGPRRGKVGILGDTLEGIRGKGQEDSGLGEGNPSRDLSFLICKIRGCTRQALYFILSSSSECRGGRRRGRPREETHYT